MGVVQISRLFKSTGENYIDVFVIFSRQQYDHVEYLFVNEKLTQNLGLLSATESRLRRTGKFAHGVCVDMLSSVDSSIVSCLNLD